MEDKAEVFASHTRPLFTILIVTFTLAALHISGLEVGFYENLWWFDIVNHFLGGLFVGLAAIFLYFDVYSNKNKKKSKYFVAIVSVIIIGVLWELFEWYIGVFDVEKFLPDTPIDIVMDLLGAAAAAFFTRK